MLLVDHDESEMQELHRIFYHGMRPHEYLHRTVGNALQHFAALLAFHNASEQFHTDGHILQEFADGGQMLLGQDLRRSHDTGLIAVVESYEH